MATNNAINLKSAGVPVYDGSGTFASVALAKGQLLTYDDNTGEIVALPKGADGQALFINDTEDTGLEWATGTGGSSGQVLATSLDINSTTTLLDTISTQYNYTPTISDGTEICSIAYTPTNASNILLFEFSGSALGGVTDTDGIIFVFSLLFEGSTLLNGQSTSGIKIGGEEPDFNINLRFYKVAGTTSETTYSIRCAGRSGTGRVARVNGGASADLFNGLTGCVFKITELTA